MDREAMIAELEQGETPQASETRETPQVAETKDAFDYYLGDKASRIPGSAEFAIKHNGQLLRVPASKLINNYRQSSHLESKLKELQGKYDAYAKEVGDLDTWKSRAEELGKYEQLQKWSEQYPERFATVWEALEQASTGIPAQKSDDFSALHNTIKALNEKISGLEKWKSDYEQSSYEAAVEQEKAKIEQEVKAFEKTYEKYGIKLDEQDEEGIPLKSKILKFAVDNEIKNFEVAAIAYLKDTLLDRSASMARDEGVKNAKGDVAAGILSRSSNPSSGQGAKVDVRKMSAEDRRKAALEELQASEA